MLNYEGEYCEVGDTCQMSVAVLGAAMWAGSTDTSVKQLTSYVTGDSMEMAAAARLKMLCNSTAGISVA